MTKRNKTARLAGLTYLILIIFGILNLLYFPKRFIVWDNAALTYQNIVQSELLFRFSIVSGIIMSLSFMILPFVLYKLLKKANKTQAKLMVIFVLMSIPISLTNILNKFAVLTLINKPAYLQHIPNTELETQVMLHMDYYSNGIEISQIFWGLWLLPFGYLVYKSGFLPKILGIFLMIGCFGYLTAFFGGFLFENYSKTLFSTLVDIPSSIGEIGICLWLLIMGTNKMSLKKGTKTIRPDS